LDPDSPTDGVAVVAASGGVAVAARTGSNPRPYTEVPILITAARDARVRRDPVSLRFVVESGSHRWNVDVPTVITERVVPDMASLYPNYPNPFNPETWIPFQLTHDAEVAVDIYNMRGDVVRRLDLGYRAAGFYTSSRDAAYWDGLNDSGERVASGVYVYRLRAGGFSASKRMVVGK